MQSAEIKSVLAYIATLIFYSRASDGGAYILNELFSPALKSPVSKIPDDFLSKFGTCSKPPPRDNRYIRKASHPRTQQHD